MRKSYPKSYPQQRWRKNGKIELYTKLLTLSTLKREKFVVYIVKKIEYLFCVEIIKLIKIRKKGKNILTIQIWKKSRKGQKKSVNFRRIVKKGYVGVLEK